MKLGGSLERRRRRGRRSPDDGGSRFSLPEVGGKVAAGVVGLAFIGWFVGYMIATRVVFPAPPPPGDMFEVPDLSGVDVQTARERLAGASLELGDVDSIAHPTVPDARVVGQSPLPGQAALPGSAVSVTLSLGPQTRSVPDVLGLAANQAMIVLEASGFVVRSDSVESQVPRGRIVTITPEPDRVVALPAEVQIRISTGPPSLYMPSVLGLEEAEAVSMLDSLGFVVMEVEEVFRFGRDQGIVVEQEPAADTELQRGAEVNLSVGRRGG